MLLLMSFHDIILVSKWRLKFKLLQCNSLSKFQFVSNKSICKVGLHEVVLVSTPHTLQVKICCCLLMSKLRLTCWSPHHYPSCLSLPHHQMIHSCMLHKLPLPECKLSSFPWSVISWLLSCHSDSFFPFQRVIFCIPLVSVLSIVDGVGTNSMSWKSHSHVPS